MVALAVMSGPAAFADTFGTGSSTFEISFVPIGAPGNMPDMPPGRQYLAGGVDYSYRIATYEITEYAVRTANDLGNLGITTSNFGPNRPATELTWNEAATFVNWLNTSQGFSPAYKFVESTEMDMMGNPVTIRELVSWEPGDLGYDASNELRNSLANYAIPTLDEWYKAAFYDPIAGEYRDFPTGDATPIPVASGTAPGTAVYRQNFSNASTADVFLAGGPSAFGTVGQGGNVWEFLEADFNPRNNMPLTDLRLTHGGSAGSPAHTLSRIGMSVVDVGSGGPGVGFRVVSLAIPEPSSVVGAIVLLVCLSIYRATALHGARA
jgi:hypothetical protein